MPLISALMLLTSITVTSSYRLLMIYFIGYALFDEFTLSFYMRCSICSSTVSPSILFFPDSSPLNPIKLWLIFAEIHMSSSIDLDDKRVRCRTSTERVGLPVREHVGLSVGCTCREDCCCLHTSRGLFGLTPPTDSSDPRRRSQHGHESTEVAPKAASAGAEHLK